MIACDRASRKKRKEAESLATFKAQVTKLTYLTESVEGYFELKILMFKSISDRQYFQLVDYKVRKGLFLV